MLSDLAKNVKVVVFAFFSHVTYNISIHKSMKKILIVEDEAQIRREYVQAIIQAGFETLEAADGQEAVTMAVECMPDAIVLDLILPKKHGFDVLKEIREEARTRDIPVVVTSNLAGADNEAKAVSLGAQGYIVKTPGQTAPIVDWLLKVIK
jgi:PleD family two-component response regulator